MKVRYAILPWLVLFIAHPLPAQPVPPGIRPTPPVLPPPPPPVRAPRAVRPIIALPMRGKITKIEEGMFTVTMLPSEREVAVARREAARAKAATRPNAPPPEQPAEPPPAEQPAAEPQPAERTFKVDAATKIFVGTVIRERKAAAGDTVRTVQMNRAGPGSLEVGQIISFALDEDHATNITQQPEMVVRAKDAATTQPSDGKQSGERDVAPVSPP